MTKEEAVNKAIEIEFGLGNTRSIREHNSSLVKVAEHLYDLLYTSIPSDLDEAARGYADESCFDDPEFTATMLAFKAGAEWMAGQGYTTEKKVDRTPLNGPAGICLNLHEYDGFKLGDKVIVQIRKKD